MKGSLECAARGRGSMTLLLRHVLNIWGINVHPTKAEFPTQRKGKLSMWLSGGSAVCGWIRGTMCNCATHWFPRLCCNV